MLIQSKVRISYYHSYRLLIQYVYFFLIFGLYVFILNTDGVYDSSSVYISNALIVIYSLVNILAKENRAYSAKKIFHLFIFFFMGIAPILQYKNGDQTVGGYNIYEKTYIYTNIIVLLATIIFDVSYLVSYKNVGMKNFSSKFLSDLNRKHFKEPFGWTIGILLISSLSLGFTIYYHRNSVLLLIFRGIEGFSSDAGDSGNYLAFIYESFLRPLTVVCSINYLCNGKIKIIKWLLVLMALVSCFPTSLSRLRVAAYYLPLLLILYPKLRWKNHFVILFIAGILTVFPFLNNFRTVGSDTTFEFGLDFEMFRTMNFDSYQSLAFVLQNDIMTYGKQLLVALFFWVPRSFWPDKPYMSGRMVAHDYGLWFDQISMNYFAEGYLNAGLIGIVFFVIILAYISAKFDKIYWEYNRGNVYSLFAPFYLFFVGIYFFFMRGDLMFGFQYTCALLFANYFIFKLTKKFFA